MKLKMLLKSRKYKVCLGILILFISIGMALITNNLSIFGTTVLKGQPKLDIYFDNVQVLHGSEEYKPVITPTNKREVTYNVVLEEPGEYYEFTVDAVNAGSVNAMITGISSKVNAKALEEALPSYIDYSVTYVDGSPIELNQVLKAGKSSTYKVKLTFRDDVSSDKMPKTEEDFSMSFTVDYEEVRPNKVTSSPMNKTKFRNFCSSNNPKNLLFVDTGVNDSSDSKYTDISEAQDRSILAWMDGDTMYVSAKDAGVYVKAPADSSNLMGNYGSSSVTWNKDLEKVDVSKLDTSIVTNMDYMFYYVGYNYDSFKIVGLENWNTSSVESMRYLFYNTAYNSTTFELDLTEWDTSNVVKMAAMFSYSGAKSPNWNVGDIGQWDTGNVTEMGSLFSYAGMKLENWDLDLSEWDVSKVTDMSRMFNASGINATSLKMDLSKWNTGNVTNMGYMFANSAQQATEWSVGDISNWDTHSLTNTTYMFSSVGRRCETFKLNLSEWNTINLQNISCMFYYTGYESIDVELDLSGWNTSNITNMSEAFAFTADYTTTFKLDLSGWSTDSATNMKRVFYHTGRGASAWSIGDLSNWNTSSANDMTEMFYYAGTNALEWSIGNISGWNTANVTKMDGMFSHAGWKADYSLDLSNWDVDKVTSHSNFNSSVETKITPPVWKN